MENTEFLVSQADGYQSQGIEAVMNELDKCPRHMTSFGPKVIILAKILAEIASNSCGVTTFTNIKSCEIGYILFYDTHKLCFFSIFIIASTHSFIKRPSTPLPLLPLDFGLGIPIVSEPALTLTYHMAWRRSFLAC